MKKINNLKLKAAITALILLYTLILLFTDLGCPILELTGIPCLSCGMTHALISAARLDFATAFGFHLMFWSIPLLYICFLKDGRLLKNKYLNTSFYLIIGIGFIVNYTLHFI